MLCTPLRLLLYPVGYGTPLGAGVRPNVQYNTHSFNHFTTLVCLATTIFFVIDMAHESSQAIWTVIG
jgi:hypothetical protein